MQPLAGHGLRIAGSATLLASSASPPVRRTVASIWTCPECQFKAQTRAQLAHRRVNSIKHVTRSFSRSMRKEDGKAAPLKPVSPTKAAAPTGSSGDGELVTSSLPSKTEQQRWEFSKRLTVFMDHLLARASVAGQHINAYTGTDYSGIEALRREIIEQEDRVKTSHKAMDEKKASHTEAYAKQTSAQKEIVGLLERKASWSPTDLERYMSLVRSEHVNDQAVQVAKDSLALAERELEGSRSLLERLERKQYHEEQIWSDTIRRNSTWITFGLMGFNIVLLLAQITVFEPYRRQKIVRDVKVALDERTLLAPSQEVERQVDAVVEPSGAEREALEQPLDTLFSKAEDAGKRPPTAGEVLPGEATGMTKSLGSSEHIDSRFSSHSTSWEAYREAFQDLFSERIVRMKQVEITTVALQGAASGIAAMGLLFVLLRPR